MPACERAQVSHHPLHRYGAQRWQPPTLFNQMLGKHPLLISAKKIRRVKRPITFAAHKRTLVVPQGALQASTNSYSFKTQAFGKRLLLYNNQTKAFPLRSRIYLKNCRMPVMVVFYINRNKQQKQETEARNMCVDYLKASTTASASDTLSSSVLVCRSVAVTGRGLISTAVVGTP